MGFHPEALPFILKSGATFGGLFTFAYILLLTLCL